MSGSPRDDIHIDFTRDDDDAAARRADAAEAAAAQRASAAAQAAALGAEAAAATLTLLVEGDAKRSCDIGDLRADLAARCLPRPPRCFDLLQVAELRMAILHATLCITCASTQPATAAFPSGAVAALLQFKPFRRPLGACALLVPRLKRCARFLLRRPDTACTVRPGAMRP